MCESLEFCLCKREFRRIPTIAAKIRTPPHPIWNLLTVSSGCSVNKLALLAPIFGLNPGARAQDVPAASGIPGQVQSVGTNSTKENWEGFMHTENKGSMPSVLYGTLPVDGLSIAYREAGNPGSPKVVLLHGFPASSHQTRRLK